MVLTLSSSLPLHGIEKQRIPITQNPECYRKEQLATSHNSFSSKMAVENPDFTRLISTASTGIVPQVMSLSCSQLLTSSSRPYRNRDTGDALPVLVLRSWSQCQRLPGCGCVGSLHDAYTIMGQMWAYRASLSL